MEKIKAEIERPLKSKFIQTVRYVEWLANTVPIIKKNGSLRVCIDFRDLNAATPKDEYAMPIAEMLVDYATGFEYLSMLDGCSRYNQIFIAEEDVSKTAFGCPGALGTYEWVVMPFGLKNAGATYQRAGDFLGFVVHKKAFSPLLRLKNEDFKWKKEHQEAFDRIKEYLTKPPVLAPPVRNRPMRLYITTSESTIGSMLVQEDGKSVERLVYYLSRMLNDPKTSRIGKWALALTKYSLTYVPLKAMKGQVVADFLVDHSMVEMAQNYVDIVPWRLYFDGSRHKNGFGMGGVIISPNGIPVEFKYIIEGVCTNNEAKYEALITELELLLELGARNVEIMGGSELVIKQVSKEYKLLKRFEQVSLLHIPRKQNQRANDLAQEASGYKASKDQDEEEVQVREKVQATLLSPSDLSIIKSGVVDRYHFEILIVNDEGENDWHKPLVDYLHNPIGSTDQKIKYRALSYVLVNDELFKQTAEGVFLKCLGESEAYVVMSSVHSGACGAHQAGLKMKWLLMCSGVYLPEMLKDCTEFAKSCQECQLHGGIHHVPASELHTIVKPWPFRGWALDVIGEIKPASSKQQRYILVGIDYFTKWVEAVALINVDQEAVIDFVQSHIICRFGIPEKITTDQGSVLTGRKIQDFTKEMGIKLLTSTPYYAEVNGQVEAANKVIISLIKKHVSKKPRN
ncbi:uncharacterized protein LOC127128795 [Lathyrus oleraceus]|uniref:uncharacterized protein LOC127128795 n=1 Tax=Pisum sativum TaxID=3888 RepID=UPI0021CF8019|nr:uncharacterized protein LOC127128795 [Pisum sativum]